MTSRKSDRIFTVNSGSSSIKISLYEMDETETRILSGGIEGIGLQSGAFHVDDRLGKRILDKPLKLPNHAAALREVGDYLGGEPSISKLDAVGHRLVHGGKRFIRPHIITPDLLEELEQLVPLAPDHMPQSAVTVRVMKTNEELMIARHTYKIISNGNETTG
jgi:acetate kinase